ncbi:Hypothetical Protein FCC1311_089292 [Hondaea fermentalgiana]|uniref:Uncharacterized protein n=1 Tax=Hondaea fermentalgiana TaxID=2315210 RepID=A0A2R5GXL3_9STRA|nr:Hypothetical Protein FCC1311_089292 [Hondaea fermentalgiana]|eukprot:GBG32704.1 Hypothetical Protein FCC1311_089292 [Hondaea fermentalgiana]
MSAAARSAVVALGVPEAAARAVAAAEAASSSARANEPTPESVEKAVMDLVAMMEKASTRMDAMGEGLALDAEQQQDSDDEDDEDDPSVERERVKQDLIALRRHLPVGALKRRIGIFMATAHLVDLAACARLENAFRSYFAIDLGADCRYVIGGLRAAGLCRTICALDTSTNYAQDDDNDNEDQDRERFAEEEEFDGDDDDDDHDEIGSRYLGSESEDTSCSRAKTLLEMASSRCVLFELARANVWLLSGIRRDCELCRCEESCGALLDALKGVRCG